MLKPTDIENLKKTGASRYAIVIGVAKRARTIAEDAEASKTILIDKPVSLAITDLTEGDYKLVLPADEQG